MAKEKNGHIVMFPFMAQGHINPFLALANLIAGRYPDYTITLVSTPLNILNLQSSHPHNSKIHLKALPFRSSDHGLPPECENSDSLPFPLICRLLHASETLQPEFHSLLSDLTRTHGCPPLCIIADTFLSWTVEIARELRIFHAAFSSCGAYGFAVYSTLWLHLPHAGKCLSELRIPGFPETFRIHPSQLSRVMLSADGSDPWSVFFRRQFSLCFESEAMLCNTAEELEPFGVELLRKSFGLRLWSIGPLVQLHPKPSYSPSAKMPGIGLKDCAGWLDSRQLGSVIYISFGSQNTIGAAQMMELAMGLEASVAPFIWVVRPPVGFDSGSEFREEWLPPGFEARMRDGGQGILVRKWAPQLEILSHKSTGAFFSHCGWNSVVESLSQGVPIIGWPLAGEQFYNSMMLKELGVCVEIGRGGEDHEIKHWEVERVIGLVMGGDGKGKEMKEKAAGCADMIRDAMREEGSVTGSSLRALDDFLETVISETSENRSTTSNNLAPTQRG